MTGYSEPKKVFAHLDRLAGWRQGWTASFQGGWKPAPVTIEWDLANVCSLGCEACHFAHTHLKGPWATMGHAAPEGYSHTGERADAALVRRALDEAARCGVKGVVWSGGGEPTLHPEWPALVERAHAVGLQQGMYTHGGHLTPETAAVLGQCATWVVVSLDAETADRYAGEKRVPAARFAAAANGIRYLATQPRLIVGVSYLLHAENWARAEAMVGLARALGATYTTLRPAIHTAPADPARITSDREWVTAALPLLEKLAACDDVEVDPARFIEYRDWTGHPYPMCYGIRLVTQITPDGRVWICPQRRGIAGSCVGDLRTESFAAVWARHPGQWSDFAQCRAMCRLHRVNTQLAPVFAPVRHEAFV